MKKRLPPLNWLRSFEASARHLNFTQAAHELNLTQAAISQQVKGLESQLGTTLFKRLPRGLALTDAGLAYMPAVHEAIGRLAAATDELFGKGQSRQLTIRVNLVFFTTWLAPRLARFYQAYPDINIRFTSHIWMDEKNKDTDTDVDIRYGHGVWPGLKSDRLTWDSLFPVCSPDMLAGQSLPLGLEALAEYRLLHVIGYEEGWGYWLDQSGAYYSDTCSGFQFDTLITALEMAVQGQGFALGRTSLVADMIAKGQLVAPFEEKIETSEAFFLTTPISQYLNPSAELFRDWILEEAQIANQQAEHI